MTHGISEDGSRYEAAEAGERREAVEALGTAAATAGDVLPHHTVHVPPNPNASVVRGTPPDARALLVAALAALLTLAALLAVAVAVQP
jgi:hypothetical protein